jgi:hypothetical protein
MSYQTIVDGAKTLLSTVTGFTATGAVRDDDYEQANAGVEKFITLAYDGFRAERDTFQGHHWIHWRIRIRLYNQMVDNIAVDSAVQTADRQAIINKVLQYPMLNGTAGVFDAWITEGGRDDEPRQLGDSSFVREWLMLNVQEDVSGGELE